MNKLKNVKVYQTYFPIYSTRHNSDFQLFSLLVNFFGV